MKDLYKMTKEELVAKCRRLQSENEKLQDELDRLSDCYYELENKLVSISLDNENSIIDVNHFKFRLSLEDMLTIRLESFIDEYLRFYNEVKG